MDPWYLRAARGAGDATRAFREALLKPAMAAPPSAQAGFDRVAAVSVREGEPPREAEAQIAPFPLIDRYPIVIGSNLTMATIQALKRLCTTGYRREYVDMLDELLEEEPHGYAVLAKRVFVAAGARIEITPKQLPTTDPRRERAGEIAEFCEGVVLGLPDLATSLAGLNWGLYYGVNGAETSYGIDNGKLVAKRLHFVHSRRLMYPDPLNWRVHIWDQGAVYGGQSNYSAPTNRAPFGIAADDLPGKFIIHTPRIRGDYPTREGLGRQLASFFGMKRMGARVAGQYIERFSRPWPLFYASTQPDGKPRRATTADIQAANTAVQALGTGSMAGAVLPDSIKAELQGPGVTSGSATLTPAAWLTYLNGEISKAVLGETLTTDSGPNGNRAAAEVHKQGSMELARYDAGALADTLKRDLITWLVVLNYPGDEDLIPEVKIIVEEKPDPQSVIDVASKAILAGLPVQAEGLAQMLGLPIVDVERPDNAPKDWQAPPRRMAPLSPVDFHELDPKLGNEDEEDPLEGLSPDDVKELARQVALLRKPKTNGIARNGVATHEEDAAPAA